MATKFAGFAGFLLSWFIHTVALIYGKLKLHKNGPAVCPEDLQGVSIIKPLVGVDSHLYYNLETFFKITYPKHVHSSAFESFAENGGGV
ncbi:hypothetical protein DPMN_011749 [Dreissena polymorpha]|uniref:Uncharacterized protein n=1 Tax=Dreissena polymorpha TaxID=45954 RepID=A0A9D4S253_DREPO|nr:hypothetical protein DPMN_011749 [Dreissena polymorpha]